MRDLDKLSSVCQPWLVPECGVVWLADLRCRVDRSPVITARSSVSCKPLSMTRLDCCGEKLNRVRRYVGHTDNLM
ncbi:hypothetical protein K466DRAFT_201529 [Polyporus arcularius HHB13444]|uniref:Uncharacterized protein n=1 Tax=Polyporus arcularius HHB13444 TaxID=1314778 RepID=A0A5C3Q2T6_9APHY|nr:hypothetical protein K466DRAFT_201529 [Polyporus arcularius HHB13444]